jgi:hypothetical protein
MSYNPQRGGQPVKLISSIAGCTNLACPGCGGDFLRQGKVTVYNREKEDSETGAAVTISTSEFKGPPSSEGRPPITREKTVVMMSQEVGATDGNPSDRRQGLTIAFTCEQGCTANLTVIQHKGNTVIEWVDIVED